MLSAVPFPCACQQLAGHPRHQPLLKFRTLANTPPVHQLQPAFSSLFPDTVHSSRAPAAAQAVVPAAKYRSGRNFAAACSSAFLLAERSRLHVTRLCRSVPSLTSTASRRSGDCSRANSSTSSNIRSSRSTRRRSNSSSSSSSSSSCNILSGVMTDSDSEYDSALHQEQRREAAAAAFGKATMAASAAAAGATAAVAAAPAAAAEDAAGEAAEVTSSSSSSAAQEPQATSQKSASEKATSSPTKTAPPSSGSSPFSATNAAKTAASSFAAVSAAGPAAAPLPIIVLAAAAAAAAGVFMFLRRGRRARDQQDPRQKKREQAKAGAAGRIDGAARPAGPGDADGEGPGSGIGEEVRSINAPLSIDVVSGNNDDEGSAAAAANAAVASLTSPLEAILSSTDSIVVVRTAAAASSPEPARVVGIAAPGSAGRGGGSASRSARKALPMDAIGGDATTGHGAATGAEGCEHAGLSERTERLLGWPLQYYYAGSAKARADKYDAVKNPDGMFELAIAQNVLPFDMIEKRLGACRDVAEKDVARYANPAGLTALRSLVAELLQTLLLPRGEPKLDANNVVVMAGATGVLDCLAFALCDAGDCVLIPTPYYPAFDNDFGMRHGVEIIPVHTMDVAAFEPTEADLERAWQAAGPAKQERTRALVLTNPTNPMGTVWPRRTVKALVAWALGKGLHVIGDEVYVGSIFAPQPRQAAVATTASVVSTATAVSPAEKVASSPAVGEQSQANGDEQEQEKPGLFAGFLRTISMSGRQRTSFDYAASNSRPQDSNVISSATGGNGGGSGGFASVLEVAREMVASGEVTDQAAQERVHIVYGVSKDFTLNGFRTGFLVSRNTKLLKLAASCSIFAWVSQDTQAALQKLLGDSLWVSAFLAESRIRLQAAASVIKNALDTAGVPYVEPQAAMFLFADMRRWLREPTFAAEHELWTLLKDQAGIVLLPGEATHIRTPGFFRITYAAVPVRELRVASERIIKFAKERSPDVQ